LAVALFFLGRPQMSGTGEPSFAVLLRNGVSRGVPALLSRPFRNVDESCGAEAL
jgi:hypothetical protein